MSSKLIKNIISELKMQNYVIKNQINKRLFYIGSIYEQIIVEENNEINSTSYNTK